MENCEIKYGSVYRNFATKNVTVAALVAVFGIEPSCSCWLKDLSETYVFPNEIGTFPTLDGFAMYDVEVGTMKQKRSQDSSDDDNSSDSEFKSTAYKLATELGRKSKGKGKAQLPKAGKGKRAVPTSKAGPSASTSGLELWYFKVTIGEWKMKKVVPVKNCLIKCSVATTCSLVKEELSRELMVPQRNITLFDSDYLEVTDSPGRIGMLVVISSI
jgi:hypothetical protein